MQENNPLADLATTLKEHRMEQRLQKLETGLSDLRRSMMNLVDIEIFYNDATKVVTVNPNSVVFVDGKDHTHVHLVDGSILYAVAPKDEIVGLLKGTSPTTYIK